MAEVDRAEAIETERSSGEQLGTWGCGGRSHLHELVLSVGTARTLRAHTLRARTLRARTLRALPLCGRRGRILQTIETIRHLAELPHLIHEKAQSVYKKAQSVRVCRVVLKQINGGVCDETHMALWTRGGVWQVYL